MHMPDICGINRHKQTIRNENMKQANQTVPAVPLTQKPDHDEKIILYHAGHTTPDELLTNFKNAIMHELGIIPRKPAKSDAPDRE